MGQKEEIAESVDHVMSFLATVVGDENCRSKLLPIINEALSTNVMRDLSKGKKILGSAIWNVFSGKLGTAFNLILNLNNVEKKKREEKGLDTSFQNKNILFKYKQLFLTDMDKVFGTLGDAKADPKLKLDYLAAILTHPQFEDLMTGLSNDASKSVLKSKITEFLSTAFASDGIITKTLLPYGINISVLQIQQLLVDLTAKFVSNPKELTNFLKSLGETLKTQATINSYAESNIDKVSSNKYDHHKLLENIGLDGLVSLSVNAEGKILVSAIKEKKTEIINKLLTMHGMELPAAEFVGIVSKIVESTFANPQEITSFLNEIAGSLKQKVMLRAIAKADTKLIELAVQAGASICTKAQGNISNILNLNERENPNAIANILLTLGIDPEELKDGDLSFLVGKVASILEKLIGKEDLLHSLIVAYVQSDGDMMKLGSELLSKKELGGLIENLAPVIKDFADYAKNKITEDRLDSVHKISDILGAHDDFLRNKIQAEIKLHKGEKEIIEKVVAKICDDGTIAIDTRKKIQDKYKTLSIHDKKRLELHAKRILLVPFELSVKELASVFKAIPLQEIEKFVKNIAELFKNEKNPALLRPLLEDISKMIESGVIDRELLPDIVSKVIVVLETGGDVEKILLVSLEMLEKVHDNMASERIPNLFLGSLLGIKIKEGAAKSFLSLTKELLTTQFEVETICEGGAVQVEKKTLLQLVHEDKKFFTDIFKLIEVIIKQQDKTATFDKARKAADKEALLAVLGEIMRGANQTQILDLLVEKGIMSQIMDLVVKSGILKSIVTELDYLEAIFGKIDVLLQDPNCKELVLELIRLFPRSINLKALNNHIYTNKQQFLTLDTNEERKAFLESLTKVKNLVDEVQKNSTPEAQDALIGILNVAMNIEPSLIRANDINLKTFGNLVELGNLMVGVLFDPENVALADKNISKINKLVDIATCPATRDGTNNTNRGIRIGVVIMDLLSDKEVIRALNKAFIKERPKKGLIGGLIEKLYRPPILAHIQEKMLTDKGKQFRDLMGKLWNEKNSLKDFVVNPYLDFINIIELDQNQLVHFITDINRAPKIFKHLKGILENQDKELEGKKDKTAELKLVFTSLNSANLLLIGGNAIISFLYWYFRESIVPALSNLVVGSDINKKLKSFSEDAKNNGDQLFDLAAKVEEVGEAITNPWQKLWMGYRLKQRSFSKLTLKEVDFTDMLIDRFNFKDVKFEGGNFSNCLFNNCRFDGCYIDAKVKFENTRMDMMSARSLLKALGSNKYITVEDIEKITSNIEIVTTRSQIDKAREGEATKKVCSLADLVNKYTETNKNIKWETKDPQPTIYYQILGLFGYGPFALDKEKRTDLYKKQSIMLGLAQNIATELSYTSSQDFVDKLMPKTVAQASTSPDISPVPGGHVDKELKRRNNNSEINVPSK